MTPDQLRTVGEALFGSTWQSEMARALGVNVRTVQRWAKGDSVPQGGIYADLVIVAQARVQTILTEIVPMLEKAARAAE